MQTIARFLCSYHKVFHTARSNIVVGHVSGFSHLSGALYPSLQHLAKFECPTVTASHGSRAESESWALTVTPAVTRSLRPVLVPPNVFRTNPSLPPGPGLGGVLPVPLAEEKRTISRKNVAKRYHRGHACGSRDSVRQPPGTPPLEQVHIRANRLGEIFSARMRQVLHLLEINEHAVTLQSRRSFSRV